MVKNGYKTTIKSDIIMNKKQSVIPLHRFKQVKFVIGAIITIICFLYAHLPAEARTVALVYDDSGSMKGKNKWVYANYASQSLAALLQKDDQLASVLMSKPKNIRKMAAGQEVLKTIRKKWRTGGGTAYKAVETAMQELLKSSLEKAGSFDKQKQDWLVVMTDGQFFKPAELKKNALKKKVKAFIEKSKGRIRIVFLLIGADADKQVPQLWKEVAPEQTDIVTASDEQAIARKMSEIAALITGRDYRDTDFSKKDRVINFTSLFPVRRITVFEQTTSGTLADVEEIELPKAQEISIEPLNINSPTGNLAGRVTHCSGEKIMPAGEYNIRFKENIDKRPVQILLETAVDFRVILKDAKGNEIKPTSGGIYKPCLEQQLFVGVDFFQARTSDPLSLDDTNTKGLDVKASFSSNVKSLTFDNSKKEFLPVQFPVTPGMQTLFVEAKSPGYFHLKSNVLAIEGQDCIVSTEIALSSVDISVPYIYSKDSIPVSKIVTMKVASTKKNQKVLKGIHALSADGIPTGIILRINGKDITKDNNKIELSDISYELAIEILRNLNYQEKDASEIRFHLSAKDSMFSFTGNQADFILKPVPRNITLEPANSQWSARVSDLEQTGPFDVYLKADGNPVSKEEFDAWKIECDSSGRLSIDVTSDNTQSLFHLMPRPSLVCICWKSGGEFKVDMKGTGPFPLETCSDTVTLNIEDPSWWKKCLILILGIVLFLWWLIGIIRKPRFAKGSVVTFQRIQDRVESRPRTESLPGKWFSRWLIPYLPEKKIIRKITFTPGSTSGSLTITKDQERDNITIDGSPQERPWRHNLKLGRNATLEDDLGNRTERYTYK